MVGRSLTPWVVPCPAVRSGQLWCQDPGGGAGACTARSPGRSRSPTRRTAWCAVADVVVGALLSMARLHRQRLLGSASTPRARDCSSMHSSTAVSGGGARDNPTSRSTGPWSPARGRWRTERPGLRRLHPVPLHASAIVTWLVPNRSASSRLEVRHPHRRRRRAQRHRHDQTRLRRRRGRRPVRHRQRPDPSRRGHRPVRRCRRTHR